MRQTQMANFDLPKKWYLVDATDLVLGRLATQLADILLGRNKPQFTPHLDLGDYIIVINADKVKLTGNKENAKEYKTVSRYPGNMKTKTLKEMRAKFPERIIYEAVWGMITHNRLGRQAIKKMFIYGGSEHNHQAQNPEVLKLSTTKKKVKVS